MTVHDLLALREEALAGPEGETYRQGYQVVFDGIEFRVPPRRLWTLRAVRAARQGALDEALAELVGPDVADRLVDAGLTLDDFERLGTIGEPGGATAGPPSARSSASGS